MVDLRKQLPLHYLFEMGLFGVMMPARKASGSASSVDAWCRAVGRRGGLTGSRSWLLGMGGVRLKSEQCLHGPR